MLGLFTWALVLAYLREGPTGPRRWLAAKFLNRVTSGPTVKTKPGSLPGGWL